MQILKTIEELKNWRKQQTGKVAFVPTMGNLHAGHLSLMAHAQQHADTVIASIFVNRLQFGQGEDFERYPRTLTQDTQKLQNAHVDALFIPDETQLYPHSTPIYQVDPPAIQNELCGQFRVGHFRGVCTVVLKLFNLVQADVACLGKKDYQQLHIVRAMVEALNVPIQIIGIDTERDTDGLALSSRNQYLTPQQRMLAPQLYQQLQTVAQKIRTGANDFEALCQQALHDLRQNGWQMDYLEIRQADTLQTAKMGDSKIVLLTAGRLGDTRLIDNLEMEI